jgi:hypothetical protein
MTCGLTIVLIILILSLLIPASYVMGMTRGMAQSDGFKVQGFDGSAVPTASVQCPDCAKIQMCGWNGGADAGDMRVFCNWGSGETYG